jgi:hypothetical protein
MLEIFVDTSGWGNLVDKSQPYHQLMVQLYREAKQQKRRSFKKIKVTNPLVL